MNAARVLGLVVAAMMVFVGATLAAQGLGWTSAQENEPRALLGSVVAGLGFSLAWVTLRPRP